MTTTIGINWSVQTLWTVSKLNKVNDTGLVTVPSTFWPDSCNTVVIVVLTFWLQDIYISISFWFVSRCILDAVSCWYWWKFCYTSIVDFIVSLTVCCDCFSWVIDTVCWRARNLVSCFINIVNNTKVGIVNNNHVITVCNVVIRSHNPTVITTDFEVVDIINVNKVLLTLWQKGKFVAEVCQVRVCRACSSICQNSNRISCTKATVWYRKSHSIDEIFRVKTCFSSIQFTACHSQLASRYFKDAIYSVSCRLCTCSFCCSHNWSSRTCLCWYLTSSWSFCYSCWVKSLCTSSYRWNICYCRFRARLRCSLRSCFWTSCCLTSCWSCLAVLSCWLRLFTSQGHSRDWTWCVFCCCWRYWCCCWRWLLHDDIWLSSCFHTCGSWCYRFISLGTLRIWEDWNSQKDRGYTKAIFS